MGCERKRNQTFSVEHAKFEKCIRYLSGDI